MDARTPLPEEKRFLPAVAAAVGEWFYEFLKNDPDDGTVRCIAVSDIDLSKEYVLKLPLVVVAFTRSVGEQLVRSRNSEFTITDTFVVDFQLEPMRIKSKVTGKETPFWSYYPYEMIRNKLIIGFLDFKGPNGERVSYRGMHVSANSQMAHLVFTFIATFQWCYDEQRHADCLVDIGMRLCDPPPCIPDPECPEDEYRCEEPCK